MFSPYSQASKIAASIESFMDRGMTDKSEIFTKVVEALGVPRPTVRRVARDMREIYAKHAAILNAAPGEKIQ